MLNYPSTTIKLSRESTRDRGRLFNNNLSSIGDVFQSWRRENRVRNSFDKLFPDDERNVKISTGTKGEKIPLSFFQRLLHRPELLFVRYPPIILQRE